MYSGVNNQSHLEGSQSNIHQYSMGSQVLHEAIIDLYLQVKVRSNDEIDRFGQDQFKKERERLLKFDSLTVLDYIKTSIEILMQIKDDGNDKGNGNNNGGSNWLENLNYSNLNSNRGNNPTTRDLNDTALSSTFKSIDLPPKEYEQQLQQYEAEVRNHIKVEQQLKLHIEVLNEKIEEFDKEREEIKEAVLKEHKEAEKKLKEKFQNILDNKNSEIARINRDMQIYQAQLKQSRTQIQQLMEQQKQIELSLSQQNMMMNDQNNIHFRNFHPQIQQQEMSGVQKKNGNNLTTSYSPNSHSSTNSGKKLNIHKVGSMN